MSHGVNAHNLAGASVPSWLSIYTREANSMARKGCAQRYQSPPVLPLEKRENKRKEWVDERDRQTDRPTDRPTLEDSKVCRAKESLSANAVPLTVVTDWPLSRIGLDGPNQKCHGLSRMTAAPPFLAPPLPPSPNPSKPSNPGRYCVACTM